MKIDISTVTRRLTKDENKSLAKNGDVIGLDFNPPLFSWSNKKNSNEIRFFETYPNCIIESPLMRYVATAEGVIISMLSSTGIEKNYFFATEEYPAAIDFYNKLIEALKNNN